MKRMILRKNNLQHPAKGGSTPAFACQYAAIAPLLASQMWATRPHLGSIFEKLLHRKTFQLPVARILLRFLF